MGRINKISLGIFIFLLSSLMAYSQNNGNNNIIDFLRGEWFLEKATYHYIDNEFFQYNLNQIDNNGYCDIDYQVLIDPIYLKFPNNNDKTNDMIISNIRHNIQTLLFEIDSENVLYIGSELYYQIHIKGKNKIELIYIDESLILNLEYKRK